MDIKPINKIDKPVDIIAGCIWRSEATDEYKDPLSLANQIIVKLEKRGFVIIETNSNNDLSGENR